MPLRCSNCGSLNIDSMTMCGNCGHPLSESNRVAEPEKTKIEVPDGEIYVRCPFCGAAMIEGVLEVPIQMPYGPRWRGRDGSDSSLGYGSLPEYEGYRCETCKCILIYE